MITVRLPSTPADGHGPGGARDPPARLLGRVPLGQRPGRLGGSTSGGDGEDGRLAFGEHAFLGGEPLASAEEEGFLRVVLRL